MLEVNKLNVFYGKSQALRDVSLRVEEKEIVALVGTNGAGKTTLLNTISGLLHPASGSVEFLGERIDRLAPHRVTQLGICQIPEGRKLFSEMTVRDNLEMGAYSSAAWKRKKETLERVYQLFPVLKERRNQSAKKLSGGERQMVAIGRGLMSSPRLCMFDEPSYGLAPKLFSEVLEVIKQLRGQGITIFLVEQNVRNTLEVADRAYVLENGQIVLEGKGRDLLQNELVKKAYLGL
ncbi:MAG: ABC transporter ATP-binding protein [Dehalococcoidia bacterium]|nr:ABC transporter ATP-binding protein [Dehalococcoidia bacterium]MDH4367360.1 ABC transporter ATP-binding protein [Dehalococcoidia bacterium]